MRLGSIGQDSFDSLPGIEHVKTRPGWLAVNEVLRRFTSLGVASLLAGVVVGGIGGRLVMTISAAASQGTLTAETGTFSYDEV